MSAVYPKCIIKNCARTCADVPTYRGLCLICYGKAKKAVAADQTTWQWLEEHGLALSADDAFNAALQEAKGKETRGAIVRAENKSKDGIYEDIPPAG